MFGLMVGGAVLAALVIAAMSHAVGAWRERAASLRELAEIERAASAEVARIRRASAQALKLNTEAMQALQLRVDRVQGGRHIENLAMVMQTAHDRLSARVLAHEKDSSAARPSLGSPAERTYAETLSRSVAALRSGEVEFLDEAEPGATCGATAPSICAQEKGHDGLHVAEDGLSWP